MGKDLYVRYIGSKGVAFAWIGAAIGPVLLIDGIIETHRANFAAGAVLLIIVALSIRDGIMALSYKLRNDFIVYTALPIAILVAGVLFAFISLI